MIPVFVLLGSFDNRACQILAALVFGAACYTDYLDGNIARKYNLVTNFGKFADPIADKILVMSAFILLVAQGRMPAWVCIVMLAREFAISGFRTVAVMTGKVIAAGKLGKIKTVCQMVALLMLTVLVPISTVTPIPWFGKFGVVLSYIAMYLALVMAVVSGVDYMVRNIDVLKDN